MTALKDKILRLIRAQGPISVAHYMQIALGDPECGYYMRADPIGRDFITAPEISQIFGELIGLMFVQAWEDRGRPKRFHLVELGPGRGTLMADLLRAAKIRPGFIDAAAVSLVETSPALRAIQARTLAGVEVNWCASVGEVPQDAPLFLVANEFFDALPARQFVRGERGWHERMVTAKDETLIFALSPEAAFPPPRSWGGGPPQAVEGAGAPPAGAVFESSPASQAIIQDIAHRITVQGGIALIVDYGHAETGFGDTFQAMKTNAYADLLAEPGEADLTFHVDFAALARAAREAGAHMCAIQTQSALLESLGIHARASRLKQMQPDQADNIDSAVSRLTGPAQMGALFKAMAICERQPPGVPGFSC